MESDSLVEQTNITEECNICYDSCDKNNKLISLSCCMNTKKICIKCIKCLTVALCPYCRSNLDDECSAYINHDTISRSVPVTPDNYINFDPYSFDDFIREENVIDLIVSFRFVWVRFDVDVDNRRYVCGTGISGCI